MKWYGQNGFYMYCFGSGGEDFFFICFLSTSYTARYINLQILFPRLYNSVSFWRGLQTWSKSDDEQRQAQDRHPGVVRGTEVVSPVVVLCLVVCRVTQRLVVEWRILFRLGVALRVFFVNVEAPTGAVLFPLLPTKPTVVVLDATITRTAVRYFIFHIFIKIVKKLMNNIST